MGGISVYQSVRELIAQRMERWGLVGLPGYSRAEAATNALLLRPLRQAILTFYSRNRAIFEKCDHLLTRKANNG